MLRVLFFGELREITNVSEWEIEDMLDLRTLKESLVERWPEIHNRAFSIAVNRKIQHENMDLNAGDEIALLPPFSGG